MNGIKLKLLQKNNGFRKDKIKVPDFEDVIFTIKEPSAATWNDYVKDAKEDKDTIESEAKIFIECVHDEDDNPIFTTDELQKLVDAYGNKHRRIFEECVKLMSPEKNPIVAAEKKS